MQASSRPEVPMTNEDAGETGRRARESRVRYEDLPHADPIAFLGTDRHPLSAPPTSHDVEPPIHDDVLPRSRWTRRAIATAVGAALVLPIVASFSSDESTVPQFTSKPMTEAPPIEPGRAAAIAAPQDLPPGGLSEGASSEHAMSEERSVADWTDARQPRDGYGVITGPELGTGGPSVDESPRSVEPKKAEGVRPVSAPRAVSPRRFASRPGVPTTLDFAAAMGAVASMSIGPKQCGPDAVGDAVVAVTFVPSGQAVRAVIEDGPLRGTATGSCVALRLRNVRIEPFEGEAATVRTRIALR
jgi:hypothetical protein